MAWSTREEYYSGQGVVLIGRRTADGKPRGLRAVGNVPELSIGIETTTLEHKESTTGARGTDLRLTTEILCNLSMTIENFRAQNLADAIRGLFTEVDAAAVVDEAVKGYPGNVSPLAKVSVSSLVVEQGAATLVAYVNDATPWDYKVNLEAGSIQLNDGAVTPPSLLGVVCTGVAVGATTTLSVPNTAQAGDKVYLYGFAGVNAADVNGQTFDVVSATPSTIVIAHNSTGDTITADADSKVLFPGMDLLASYSHTAQSHVSALTEGAPELYLRFEGLNTARENSPVVVEVYRFLVDPLQDLSLIGDEIQQFVLEGSVLADTLQPTESKYFKVMKIDA